MSLEWSLETLRSPEAGGRAGRWGTTAASVLGDLAVVFRMDVPAQADGQEHPQELWRDRTRVRGRQGHPAPPTSPRPQSSLSLSGSARVTGVEQEEVDSQLKPRGQPAGPAAEGPREGQWPGRACCRASASLAGRGAECRRVRDSDLDDSDAHTHA